jgi:hypothetical protein
LVRVFKLAFWLAEEIDDALFDAELLGDLAGVVLCCGGLAHCFSSAVMVGRKYRDISC